jgi:uncharacterized protein
VSRKKFTPSPLVSAIRAGRLSGVISTLDDGADVEEVDIHGCAGLPLRTACFEGEIAIIRELLRHGANPNAMAADGPGAPLRLALRSGHPEIAALLLDHGAEAPPGLTLPEEVNAWRGKLPLAASAPASAPLLPEEVASPAQAEPAAPHPYHDLDIEEIGVDACYGTDTQLLTMELMRSQSEPEEKSTAASPPTSSFWQTRRKRD